MKELLTLRLHPEPEQREYLLKMMETFNRALQYAADLAFEIKCSDPEGLEPVVYSEIRFRYELAPELATRAIRLAAQAFRRSKGAAVQWDAHSPMVFDRKMLSFRGLNRAAVLMDGERQLVPFRFVGYTRARKGMRKNQVELAWRDGELFLDVCVEGPTRKPRSEAAG